MKALLTITALLVLTACGPTGGTGGQGPAGSPGDTGPQGPGTVVTLIQFCPNSGAPSYPNVFPEYGFCIGGSIYATYSANDGFTTLLTPGTYSSNAVGSSCTFVVGPNCSVVQQ